MKLADILKTPGNVNNFLPEQPLATVKKKKSYSKALQIEHSLFRPQNEREKNFKKKEITEPWPSYRATYCL